MDYIKLNKENTDIIIREADRNKINKLISNRYSVQIGMMRPFIDKSLPLLDVGIRDGAFLELLIGMGFTNVYGVDIYNKSVEIARAKGIDCEIADVHTMNLGKKFDTVVMSHVLEHCPYPDIALANVHRHMNEHGVLFIEVPIEYGDPKPTEKDAHFYNFHSLEDLLNLLDGLWLVLDKLETGNRIKVVARRT